MLPELQDVTVSQAVKMPSKTYKLDVANGRIVGYIDGTEAIRQAVEKILNTERYAYLIYDWFYGFGLERYIGMDFSYIEADIRTTLEIALKNDDRIIAISNLNVTQVKPNAMYVKYQVQSNVGYVDGEVVIEL